MLIGHHFFRKGGKEVLKALKLLREYDKAPVKLCIVSKLVDDLYATNDGASGKEWVMDFLRRNESWVEHHTVLSPEKVMEKMCQCDVGLLPSYAETYGYSVLEFQASARPVITTNIRAFPEINNNECGWVIPVRKKEVGGEGFYQSLDKRAELSHAIRSGLRSVVREIVSNPEMIRKKGILAWERIKSEHDPMTYGKKLEIIYQGSLQG